MHVIFISCSGEMMSNSGIIAMTTMWLWNEGGVQLKAKFQTRWVCVGWIGAVGPIALLLQLSFVGVRKLTQASIVYTSFVVGQVWPGCDKIACRHRFFECCRL